MEDLSDNIKSTLKTKRKNGEFVGSFAPYGYLVDPNNKNHLIIDETAAPVVRRIFDMYIQGSGYITIARALNDENIPPPCVHKKLLGSKYYNRNYEKNLAPSLTWSDSAIYAILRRQAYTGALVQGKQEVVNYKTGKRRMKPESQWDVVEDMHEPIISKETFLKAQEIRFSRGKGQKIPNGSCYSLAKKVFCGECGNTMWKMSYQLRDGRYNYLACRTRKTTSGLCDNKHHIRLDELEKIVVDEINKLLDKYYDEKQIGSLKQPKKEKGKDKSLTTQIKNLEDKVKRNDARMAQMYTDKLDGIITLEEFAIFREQYKKETQEMEKRIELLKTQLSKLYDNETPIDTKSIMEKYRRIDTLTFEIADEFISKIFIGKLKKDGEREIKIEWKI